MMKFIKAWIVKKYKLAQMSEEEKYLANAVDLVDLERRQRELMYGKNRFSTFTGVTHYNTIQHR
tara:strand:+ start:419 stop:610 length:192 start_codon:yes stop_codon:yes gene_type:complete